VVTIRGFTTSTTVNTNQYLDGMKLQGNNYNEVSMDPYFLERVEVMRGPTSVLYGNSNPGGIVSMVSKRPTTEPLKEIQFKMGTDNLWQTGFDFSDAIDDDGVWSYRLTGLAAVRMPSSRWRNRLATRSRPPSAGVRMIKPTSLS
jgi:iron complex outermembrane receptor protein